MTKREALKLALEALEDYRSGCQTKYDADKAITAIKEALAQPAVPQGHEQSTTCGEPVTKFDARQDADRLKSVGRGMSYNDVGEAVWKHTLMEIAMRLETGGYTTPPYVPTERQRKPLTIDQIASIAIDRSKPDGIIAFVRAIEAAHGITDKEQP